MAEYYGVSLSRKLFTCKIYIQYQSKILNYIKLMTKYSNGFKNSLVFCILFSLLLSFFVVGSIRFNKPIVPNNLEQKKNCLGKQTNRQRHRLEFLYRLNKFAMNFETRPHSQNVCAFIRDSLVSDWTIWSINCIFNKFSVSFTSHIKHLHYS